MNSLRHWWLVLPLVMLASAGASPCYCEQLKDIPNPKTRDNTWVTDLPGMLRPATVSQINAMIDDLERTTTAEMAVVVIRSLDGQAVEDVAVDLFRLWGIGKSEKDNGILFLWAPGDRKVRIEVGYGLEGVLPDGKVGAILDHYVIPSFKAGDYDDGVLQGVKAVCAVIRGEPTDLHMDTTHGYQEEGGVPFGLIMGLLGLVPAGIGSFVGYRRWRRYHRRNCPECGQKMRRLPESEEDPYLEEVKLLEETLRSVDYDVWQCPSCSHHFSLRYPKWFSKYGKCPQCHNRTCSKSEETIRPATTSSSGKARITEDCGFCTYHRIYHRTIPRISTSSSSSGSSWGGGGGGSFGGGSSGGGGASRGY